MTRFHGKIDYCHPWSFDTSNVPDPECLYPGFGFFIPDPWSKWNRIRIRNKECKNVLPKKLKLSFRKNDPGCFRIPNLDFHHPGSRDQKSTGPQILIRNTEHKCVLLLLLHVLESAVSFFLPCHLFSHFLAVIYKTFLRSHPPDNFRTNIELEESRTFLLLSSHWSHWVHPSFFYTGT